MSLVAMLGFVVPQFEKLFKDMGDALPVPTQVVMALWARLYPVWALSGHRSGFGVLVAPSLAALPERSSVVAVTHSSGTHCGATVAEI